MPRRREVNGPVRMDDDQGLRMAFETLSYDARRQIGGFDRAMEEPALRRCLQIIARKRSRVHG